MTTRRTGTTRITVRPLSPGSNRWPAANRLVSGPGGYTAHAASGREPPRSGPPRWAGWPNPRWPASLARGCLYPEHPGSDDQSSRGDLRNCCLRNTSRFALVHWSKAGLFSLLGSAASSVRLSLASNVTQQNDKRMSNLLTSRHRTPVNHRSDQRIAPAETLNRKAGEASRALESSKALAERRRWQCRVVPQPAGHWRQRGSSLPWPTSQ
jgi:hypothetical protein